MESLWDSIASSEVASFLSCLYVKPRSFDQSLLEFEFCFNAHLFSKRDPSGKGRWLMKRRHAQKNLSLRAESGRAVPVGCWSGSNLDK